MRCQEFKDRLIDYISGGIASGEALELQRHMEECGECRQEYEELRAAVSFMEAGESSLKVPGDFMKNVRKKVLAKQKPVRAYKKTFRTGLIAAAVFMMFVVTALATEGFGIMSKWRKQSLKESESVFKLIERGYGEQLNLVDEDKDVRITIKSVVADDINTVIMYEIEDRKGHIKYMPDFRGGISAKGSFNEGLVQDHIGGSMNLYSEAKNIEKGIISLSPIKDSSSNIKLLITGLKGGSKELKGEWSFDIPVKKYPSKTYTLNREFKLIEGNKIIINEITIAPTTTLLTYSYEQNPNLKSDGKYYRFDNIQNMSIISGNKEYRVKPYGSSSSYSETGKMNRQTLEFDSMYLENPENIKINVNKYQVTFREYKSLNIDINKPFPQKFDYMGSQISIDEVNIKSGETIIVMSEPMENRGYENLSIEDVRCKNNPFARRSELWDGFIIDKTGKKISLQEGFFLQEDMKDPVSYITKRIITVKNVLDDATLEKMSGNDPNFTKKLIPNEIVINGYEKGIYVDKSMNIELK